MNEILSHNPEQNESEIKERIKQAIYSWFAKNNHEKEAVAEELGSFDKMAITAADINFILKVIYHFDPKLINIDTLPGIYNEYLMQRESENPANKSVLRCIGNTTTIYHIETREEAIKFFESQCGISNEQG